jgi:hypothetical protein
VKLPEPPKIIESLNLGGYTPALQEVNLQVWVNPPAVLFSKFYSFDVMARENDAAIKKLTEAEPRDEEAIKAAVERRNEIGQARLAWLSEILSQSPDVDTHWTPEEISKAFIEEYGQTDPQLFWWVLLSVFFKINEHRTELKNFSKPLAQT